MLRIVTCFTKAGWLGWVGLGWVGLGWVGLGWLLGWLDRISCNPELPPNPIQLVALKAQVWDAANQASRLQRPAWL